MSQFGGGQLPGEFDTLFDTDHDSGPGPGTGDFRMTRFVHEGNAIDYTPTADTPAGTVVLQGDLTLRHEYQGIERRLSYVEGRLNGDHGRTGP